MLAYMTCLWLAADPVGVDLYFNRAREGLAENLVCYRGSSQLEGLFGHVNRLFDAPRYGPAFADLLLKEFLFRQQVKAGIRNRHDPDFGHFDFSLLERISALSKEQGWPNPLQGFKPLVDAPKEQFGMDHVCLVKEECSTDMYDTDEHQACAAIEDFALALEKMWQEPGNCT